MDIIRICDRPQLAEAASVWFSEKWGVPVSAYRESMSAFISKKNGVPQWYVVLDEDGRIAAGTGVIENDFHQRKDLTPNLCALYVEPAFRRRGIARNLLNLSRREMGRLGYEKLYLITSHTEFYEKCGWRFLCMVREDDGNQIRMYEADTL